MEIVDRLFKQDISVKDDKFDIDNMNSYRLYLSLSANSLRFSIIDSGQDRCMLLQDYRFFGNLNRDDLVSALNRIYDSDLFLKANFWQSVSINIKGKAFTLVPREVFNEDNPEKYLKYVSRDTHENLVVVQAQSTLEAVNVFYVDKVLVNWFHQTYPTRVIQFTHQSAAFIEAIRKIGRNSKGTQMHLFLDNNFFLCGVLEKSQLTFCNVFNYRSAQDFLYFILFVADEQRLEAENISIFLHGYVDPVSEVFKLLSTYFQDVQLYTDKASWLNFSYAFDEVPLHFYLDLLGMHLCVQA